MHDTLDRVIDIVAWHGGIPAARLTPKSAISRDLGMDGDDVTDLVARMKADFAKTALAVPWDRFTSRSETTNPFEFLLLPWQLVRWAFLGRRHGSSALERLELGHIAAVTDRGEWFEP